MLDQHVNEPQPDLLDIHQWFVSGKQLQGWARSDRLGRLTARTSTPVVGVRGRLAVTSSGRHYFLGVPRDARQWARLRRVTPNVVLPAGVT